MGSGDREKKMTTRTSIHLVLCRCLAAAVTVFAVSCYEGGGDKDDGAEDDGTIPETIDLQETTPDLSEDVPAEDAGTDDAHTEDMVTDDPAADLPMDLEICDGVFCSDLCHKILECEGGFDPEDFSECMDVCNSGSWMDPEDLACLCEHIDASCEEMMISCGMGPGCGIAEPGLSMDCQQTGPETYHCTCTRGDETWECDGTGIVDCETVECCDF
jgi:hypothetical protein